MAQNEKIDAIWKEAYPEQFESRLKRTQLGNDLPIGVNDIPARIIRWYSSDDVQIAHSASWSELAETNTTDLLSVQNALYCIIFFGEIAVARIYLER